MNFDWYDKAACRGVNPKVFHPPVQNGRFVSMRPEVRQAKRICAGCPDGVRAACLDAGKGAPGIWGGLEEHERKPANMRATAWAALLR